MFISKSEQEKRELIISSIDKSMFVEAGAGAGKSTLIVSRIINQLKNGMKPGEIVAITFTNAATHELKDRIVKAALREMKNASLTEEQREIMKSALDELDQMQISTIHSFCNRILKEKSLDAQLSVDSQLIDENELGKRREESFILWAEELKKSDWDILQKTGDYRKTALEKLKNLSYQLIDIPDDMDVKISLPLVDEAKFLTESQRIMTAFSKEFLDTLNHVYRAAVTAITDIPEDWLLKAGETFKTDFTTGDFAACMKGLVSSKASKMIKVPKIDYFDKFSPEPGTLVAGEKLTKKAIKENSKYLQSQAKECIENFAEACVTNYFDINHPARNINLILGGYENYLYEPYVSYAKKAAEFMRNRLGANVLTNNLLIQKTYELLSSSEEARLYFAGKFKCIYVDEFQDTDHVQETFIRLLAQDCTTGELRPGTLFLVGDPKQSIYRFRGAEPEVYFKTKEYFMGISDAYVIELQDNYRSNQFVIDWVNQQFASKDITPGFQYVPMNVSKVIDENILDDKTIYGVYYNKSTDEVMDINDDIQELVKLITNSVKGGYQIIDYDSKNNAYKRPVLYKDFLILSMNMKDMDQYALAFRTFGIPFVMDSKVKMKEEWYLQVFARVFYYLSYPFDRRHAEAAREGLKSLGLTYADTDLMLKHLFANIYEHTDDNKTIQKVTAIGTLKFLAQNFHLFLEVGTPIDDTEILQIQTRITQMVECVLQTSGGSTGTLMDAISLYLESEIEHELVLEDDVDAVRFMNLHKAKGLEGNIVVWTNRQENANYKSGKHRKNGILYPSVETTIKGFKTCVWNGINRDDKLIDEAKEDYYSEKVRLEYVAATRAKQAFIIMDRHNTKELLFGDNYNFGTRSVQPIITSNRFSAGSKQPVIKEYGEMLSVPQANEDLAKPCYLSETPSSLEDESAGKVEGTVVASGQYGKLKRPVGNVFGTAMHRTFELLVNRITYSKEFLDTYLQTEAMQVIEACAIQAINESVALIPKEELGDYKTFLCKMAMAFGKWWYREKMSDSIEELYTELSFSYFDTEEDTKIWWHGIADLVLKKKDGTVLIIDYKSDSDAAYPNEQSFCDRLKGKYSPQIAMYKKAVAKSLDISEEVIFGMLISFSQKNVGKGEELRVRTTMV